MQFPDKHISTFLGEYYKQMKQDFCTFQHFEKLPKFCTITSVYELLLVLITTLALINSIIFIGNKFIFFF